MRKKFIKKLLKNDKGEGLASLSLSIVIGIILITIAAFTGIAVLINAQYYVARNDLKNFSDVLETMMIEHPKLQVECGQTYDTTAQKYSAIDNTVSAEYIKMINTYIDQSLIFDAKTGRSAKVDKWGMPYEIYLSTQDLDIDPITKKVTKVVSNSVDTEIRIIIKGLGKNSTVPRPDTSVFAAAGNSLDGIDDFITIIQSINGVVKSATYGFSGSDVNIYFVDNDAKNLDECTIL